jgi:hypothetical protein
MNFYIGIKSREKFQISQTSKPFANEPANGWFLMNFLVFSSTDMQVDFTHGQGI